MMIRKYLPVTMACLLCMPALAQEGQSLGEIARKIRTESSPNHSAATPGPAAATNNSAIGTSLPVSASSEAEIVPDLNANIATDIRGIDKYEAAIRELLLHDKFETLDQIANEARNKKARFPGGFWKIHLIYEGLEQPAQKDKASDAEWIQHLAHLQRWEQQRQDSITARVALGWFYHSYGWKARGSGYADTVTEEGWRLLAERLDMGRKVLEEAQALPAKCPEWFLAMQNIALAASWDRDKLDALFERATAFEPDYYYYYRIQAQALMPKWGGEDGDMPKFAWTMGDRVGGKKGDLIYYEIGAQIICGCDNDRQLNEMSWPRLKQGYAALEELYGTSILHLNKMAYMASMSGDDDYAKALFTKIGDNWDKDTWRTRDEFVYAKSRVEGAPLRRALAEARENSKTPEGHLFDETLRTALEKDYRGKLMECMKTTPDYTLPMVGLLVRLAQDGSVRQVVMAPFNAPTGCFTPQVEKARFPAPPRDDYWAVVNMDVKK